ncbi:uncharacterized protein LY79DRAFT_516990 [Colletotrichum navitas]|uniref:FHA domain-containing protein n=1 Tax=Colletotrichum navitas TaxID=681940 RepID=A0AAD8V449_9PEZI|nr:uncharacterized protein LY79DRAFT_516990 [Colletotrichum navitas]KAK1589936.1 hypothetical protein LY79DRAFT_516990 [Colletotrichum navitas]
MENTNVIAWLLPSSTNQPAIEAVRMPQNATRRVKAVPSSYDPVVQTPNPGAAPSTPTIDPSVLTKSSSPSGTPRPALELSFTSPPRNHVGFVLGTDPDVCDVVLPSLSGISPVHCHITFDADRRLALRDTSEAGTAVWYDGASSGDRRRESWALSAGCTYAFPAMVDRVVVDIQTVRFQVLVNESHMLRPDAYRDSVDAFMASLASGCIDDVDDGDRMDFLPFVPSVVPPMYVKYLLASDDGAPPETYLWNTTRPWEPMIKVAC